MFGVITKLEIIAHPLVTVRCFGWPLFMRALLAPPETTFLSLLSDLPYQSSEASKRTQAVIARAVHLEKQAQEIYTWLAGRFIDEPEIAKLFKILSREEQQHAHLLSLCREIAPHSGWIEHRLADASNLIETAEPKLQEYLEQVKQVENMNEALRLAIKIESCEINPAFATVVGATDSSFVRKLNKFQESGAAHINYLARRIKSIAPALATECDQMTTQRGQACNN